MLFFPTVDEDVQYFRSQGYTGSINDMHFKAMGDLGYTGSLSDRIHAYLTFKYGSYYEAMRDLRNGTSVFALSAYIVNNLDPALVLDFGANYFRKSGSKSTLSDTVTHSRASNASMVDADGVLKWAPHNLLRYSEDFSNAAWSKFAGLSATVSSMTFSADPYSRIVTSVSNPTAGDVTIKAFFVPSDAGKIVTLGLWDSTRNGSSSGRSTNLTIPASGIVEYSWTSVSGVTNIGVMSELSGLAQTVTFASGLAYYRSDLGGMVNNPERGDSYVPTTTAAVYMPRVGHHIYDGYEWVNEGILHESAAATNLNTYSEPDTGTNWLAIAGAILTAQSDNVLGAFDGVKVASAGSVDDTIRTPLLGSVTSGSVYTVTVIWNAGTSGKIRFRLDESGIGSSIFLVSAAGVFTASSTTKGTGLLSGHTALGNDVYQTSVTWTPNFTGGTSFAVGPDSAVSGEYITAYTAELKAGSTPSSYIPTAGATVTRAAETLTVPAANMPDYMTPTVIGPESVTNGTFDTDTDWTKGGGWTIAGGGATNDGTNDYQLSQLGVVTGGKVYELSYEITAYTSGVVSASLGEQLASNLLRAEALGTYTKVMVASSSNTGVFFYPSGTFIGTIDNISVKEINPLSVSIQMQGKMNYADGGSYADGAFFDWSDGTDFITYGAGGNSTDSGKVAFVQREAGVQDVVFSSNEVIAEGVFSPFNLSSRHGSTFINGAVDGTALTADLTPTALPDLSAANFQIGTIFNGTISKLRVWGEDISDTGIATASAPTFTDEFAMTVTTTTANETFTIPCQNIGTFNAGIQWGDGSVSTVTAYNDANLTHTFATAGDHLIRIRGSFPSIYFNNVGDKLKVKSVDNLGIVGWTKLNNAFYGCSNMTSFTVGTTDTSAVTTMTNMFKSCSSLTALDVSSFNTTAVTDTSEMFRTCSSLTSLDLSSFNTAAVTTMDIMFRDCSSLTSLDLSSFNTAAVTNIKRMFHGCSSLTAVDVSSFNTTAVTNMSYMFYSCSSLTSLDVSSFNTAAVTTMFEMFRGCSSLTSLDLSNFNTAVVTNMSSMFRNCSSLPALDVSNFNTAAVKAMGSMFRDCSSITALDLSNFNTTAVTDMGAMFYGCSSLTALDVSNFNTTAVMNTSYMFYDCSGLTALDVSSFNTAAAVSMNNMFQNCSSLTSLDLSNFNTAAVTNMNAMFRYCTSLTALDLSSFNTAAVTNMASMFQNCTSTTDIIGVEDFNIEGLNSTGDLNNFMTLVTLPTARYDALLINWDAQEPFDAMTPNFGSSTYTGGGTAAAARANLISNDLWVITDGGIA